MTRFFDMILAEEEMQRMQEKIEDLEGACAEKEAQCSALEAIIQDVREMLSPEERALVAERHPMYKEEIE